MSIAITVMEALAMKNYEINNSQVKQIAKAIHAGIVINNQVNQKEYEEFLEFENSKKGECKMT